jgi:hypothetical protein
MPGAFAALDDYPKMNDWSAKWLADKVVAAPFVTRVVERAATGKAVVELCSAEDAGLEYDECVEWFNKHRYWSNQCHERRGSGGLANTRWRHA